jgi:hypothetical protein
MKHVLVIDSHNTARPFIEEQGLKHPLALRDHVMDFEKLFRRPELMQSTDGIQFYLFPHKFPATNAGHFTGFEHLDKHLAIIESRIASHNKVNRWKPDRQEQLDAVVLPEGIIEKPSTLRWLERVKERWPNLKVLVTNPPIHAPTDPLRDDVFVQALHDSIPPNFTDPHYHPTDRNPYVPVQHNATNFKLAPCVDMATPNLRSHSENGLLLRNLIGLPMQIGAVQGRG